MKGIIHAGIALAAVLSVAACQRTDTAGPAASPAAETTPATAASGAIASRADAAGGTARDRAMAAMRDGRMYTPAGDSAIDHWLAARAQSPGDDAIASAIVELQPYLLIACEQAIANGQFDEARRLLSLMSRSTPTAPALPRLDQAIAAGEAQVLALEAQAEEEARALAAAGEANAKAAQEEAAAAAEIAAAATATPAPAAPPAATLATPASEQAPENEVVASTTPPRQPQPPPPPPPAEPVQEAAQEAGPVLVHAAAPRYPMIAMHRGVEGRVEVAFTVQPDGSVANARVRSSTPEGTFDNAALDAVAEYRFQPGPEKHDIVQTIHFRLPDRG